MKRALLCGFAALFLASCTNNVCPTGQQCGGSSGGSTGGVTLGSAPSSPQDGSTPDIVVNTGTVPTGGYQSACQGCALASSFQLGTTSTQTYSMGTLYCSSCATHSGNTLPAILLNASLQTAEINFCETNSSTTINFGALVPCDCTDTACVTQYTTVPSSLSGDNAYLSSCSGCSVVITKNGNSLLACGGCFESNGVTTEITAIALTKGTVEEVVDNCDGQLVARKSSANCPNNDKTSWLSYLEKVWDKVSGAFGDAVAFYVKYDPEGAASVNGQEFTSALADAGADSTEDVDDVAISLFEVLASVVPL